eukprot:9017101-Alexandrium_andersonii.AAC.1
MGLRAGQEKPPRPTVPIARGRHESPGRLKELGFPQGNGAHFIRASPGERAWDALPLAYGEPPAGPRDAQ